MGDLFANIGTTNWGRETTSANDLEFLNVLTSPSTDLNLGLDSPEEKQRRVSAPSAPFIETVPVEKNKEPEKVLWALKEEEDEETEIEKERARRKLLKGAIRTSLIQSHSMDDLTQIEIADENSLHVPGQDFQAQLMSLKVSSELVIINILCIFLYLIFLVACLIRILHLLTARSQSV